MASNLIGRLAEATNPVASIAGPKARTRAGRCGPSEGLSRHLHFSFAPLSLPPYLERFHRNLGAPGGFWSAGRGGSGKDLVEGWGREPSAQGLSWTRGPQAADGSRQADHGPGVSGRGLLRLGWRHPKATCHFQQ